MSFIIQAGNIALGLSFLVLMKCIVLINAAEFRIQIRSTNKSGSWRESCRRPSSVSSTLRSPIAKTNPSESSCTRLLLM